MRHPTPAARRAGTPPGIRRGHGPVARRPSMPPPRRHHRTTATPTLRRQVLFDPLALAAGTWLACGIVLLGMTPLPLHYATLGWSPAFWLLLAPAMVLGARTMSKFPEHAETPAGRQAMAKIRPRASA